MYKSDWGWNGKKGQGNRTEGEGPVQKLLESWVITWRWLAACGWAGGWQLVGRLVFPTEVKVRKETAIDRTLWLIPKRFVHLRQGHQHGGKVGTCPISELALIQWAVIKVSQVPISLWFPLSNVFSLPRACLQWCHLPLMWQSQTGGAAQVLAFSL